MSAQPGRWHRALLHPAIGRGAFALLLLGFATAVGIYMHVINRYVHYSVRVEATPATEAGGHAAVRIHPYRPNRLDRLRGVVSVHTAGQGPSIQLAEASLSSAVPTLFQLPVPPHFDEAASFEFRVSIEGQTELRTVGVTIPIRSPDASDAIVGLPAAGSARLIRPQTSAERAQVQRIRSEPADAPIAITVIAETSFPVRFLENRFLIRVTERNGYPAAGHVVTAEVVDSGIEVTRVLVTDEMGLCELRATPIDIETWRLRTTHEGVPVWVQFEIVPGFDGLILRREQPIVASDGALLVELHTDSSADRWYYNVVSDAFWLSTGVRALADAPFVLRPPDRRWFPNEALWRYAEIQSTLAPFASTPQSSVRGVLFRPSDATDLEAARRLVHELGRHPLDGDYMRALRATGLPGPETPPERLYRLIDFALARLLPTFRPLPVAYDDTSSQTQALLAETTAFRRRMHWLLGLGVVGLMCWIAGRIALYQVQTRRRAQALLRELDDEQRLDHAVAGLSAGRGAIVPIALAAVTISAFFVGILFMLATM